MMKLRLIPLFLMMVLASVLGACETANREIPAPPVNQGESPQGGAELNQSEDEASPSIQEETPASDVPLSPDGGENSPENSDEPSP
ncbi:hypothetical protein [Acaryochloris marina]|uniref:Lipoprotein n=1 Tax=Acaryochloris marina (strain MBIC 11017) TaxID=329726 RepID=B0C3Q8_ACAM1|nr:hypothetical protein [Acaryochloris marina]ABW30995.1 conserved hypothetical protein [Acaryochloris marina MBIC11017]BDM79718.1 hypothetical protein AM10699_25860 [Acaryochloris marina MBIC10699]